MTTNTAIKFYKNAYGLTEGIANVIATSTANPGGIYFDTTTKQIYVAGVAFGGAVADATYANGVLTITKSNGTTQTLDFNDVASANATLKVFQHMNALMGVGTDANNNTVLDYTGANYISTATSLTDADKKLDAAIKAVDNKVVNMDGSASPIVDSTAGDVIKLTINTVSQSDGTIADGTNISTVTFATVAKTGNAGDVAVADSGNVFTGTNVEAVLSELNTKITSANVTIDALQGAFTTDESMLTISSDSKVIGVKTTGYIGTTGDGIDLVASKVDTAGSSTTDTDLATVKTVTTHISSAIDALEATQIELATIAANAITIKGIKEEDGIISASGTTTIPVDGTVSDNNPLVTKNSISSAIEDLDVTGYVQGTVTGSAITVYGIKEEYGKIGSDTTNNLTIELDGTYNASTNKVALKSTVTDAINALDTQADVQPVVYTAATGNNGAKLTFKGVSETDGVIAQGSGSGELQFAKVATTGSASDVSVTYTVGTNENASSLQAAVNDIDSRLDSLETLPTFDTVVCSTANDTPSGITWGTNPAITGSLTASDDTMHKIYLVPATGSPTAPNSYAEYITVKDVSNYKWEKVGDTATDLTGYVKTVNVNGKEFAVTNNTTSVNLGDSITSITDGDENITTSNGFTHDYVDSEVTVISTKDATTGTYAASVISTATVKVQAVGTSGDSAKGLAEASDVKAYVGSQIEALDVELSTVTGTNVKVSYSETDGKVTISNVSETYATVGNDLTVSTNTGLVKGSDIEKVKTYVDNKVDGLDTNGTVTGTNVSFEYKETDGVITIGTMAEKYATVQLSTTGDPTLTVTNGTQLAVGSDIEKVKEYTDYKISTVINSLDANVTSTTTAIATVQVVEQDGKITGVNVTTQEAGVVYTAKSGDTPANLTANSNTGAVIGTDIATIKQYIDAKAAEATAGVEVEDASAVIPVGTTAYTTLGTVNGTAITAKVSYTWEEYV